MEPSKVNPPSISNSSRPAPLQTRGAGQWNRWLPIGLIILGLAIVSYPFWPAVSYALRKPQPILPYQTKLSNLTVNNPLDNLPRLPVVGNKPVPLDNRLVIPSIKVDMTILEGPDEKTLNRGGIWHIPNTSDPERGSNMVLSGHRWQYLPPSNATLYLLDKVQVGEPVIIYWHGQEYDYRITGREVVDPNRTDILGATVEPRLTIFTCTPLYSTKQRLVLYGSII